MNIETRGIRCLDCKNVNLRTHPEHAKTGYGVCTVAFDTFVRLAMSRNCIPYEPADADTVKAREDWVSKNTLPMWPR